MDWDSQHSKDVTMRKKCESGEELAISAILGEETFLGDDCYPKEVDMKVCIKKTGLTSILQFDCKVLDQGQDRIDFHIQNAYYLKLPTDFSSSVYRGPLFRYVFTFLINIENVLYSLLIIATYLLSSRFKK